MPVGSGMSDDDPVERVAKPLKTAGFEQRVPDAESRRQPMLKAHVLRIPYDSIKNISGPEDKENSRTVYAGQMPILAVINLPTNENARGYLVEAEGQTSAHPYPSSQGDQGDFAGAPRSVLRIQWWHCNCCSFQRA